MARIKHLGNLFQTGEESSDVNDREVIDSQEKMVENNTHEESPKKYTSLDLFKTPRLRRYTIIMFYLW